MKWFFFSTFLFVFFCFSCQREEDAIFLWECNQSRLYLNTIDTCWKVRDRNSSYDLYLSLKHNENFNRKSVDFRITIGNECDTVTVTLVNDNNSWNGAPYISSYVSRTQFRNNISFPDVENVLFTITPVCSNVLDGIDWLAIELESK